MTVETSQDVAKFLQLQTLTLKELQTQCVTQDIQTDSESTEDLIKALLNNNNPEKEQGILPQGIPLRSKNKFDKPILKASQTYKDWRTLIFDTSVIRDFQMVNRDGEQYTIEAYYIRCTTETASYMIKHRWHAVYKSQKRLIQEIEKSPNKFEYHIIRKQAGNGNNFLMLHCQVKKD